MEGHHANAIEDMINEAEDTLEWMDNFNSQYYGWQGRGQSSDPTLPKRLESEKKLRKRIKEVKALLRQEGPNARVHDRSLSLEYWADTYSKIFRKSNLNVYQKQLSKEKEAFENLKKEMKGDKEKKRQLKETFYHTHGYAYQKPRRNPVIYAPGKIRKQGSKKRKIREY